MPGRGALVFEHMLAAPQDVVVGSDDRDAALGRLLAELESLSVADIWRVRLYAGMLGVAHEERSHGRGLVEFLDGEGGGLAVAVLSMLDVVALARLGRSGRHWRSMPQWSEIWFLLGVRDFGKRRRLVPPGRFERFDEAMLDADVDWRLRYLRFSAAAHCPSIESLRLAAVRVAQSSLGLETFDVEEVRRRLADELQLGHDFLSLECVEQLLEDASTMRVLGGRGVVIETPEPPDPLPPPPPPA